MNENTDVDSSEDEQIDDSTPLAVSSTYKMLGELTASDGVGVLGQNNANSGTPIGVQGAVPNADGYGLATPDDARIEGSVETTTDWRVLVDGNRAMALESESSGGAGNIVLGYSNNSVGDGATGATISGGGNYGETSDVEQPNEVYDDYGTISGGYDNQAGSDDETGNAVGATVGGGRLNSATGGRSIVGGGQNNSATASDSTVGGGRVNTASGKDSVVGGGWANDAAGEGSTVGGGWGNEANTEFATIAGGGPTDKQNAGTTSNVVYDDYGTIGGGGGNVAGSDNADIADGRYATVSGGETCRAQGAWSSVGGGFENEASATSSTVAGGSLNVASDGNSMIPGGRKNTASGEYSFAAGYQAKAVDDGAFVWTDSRDQVARSDTAPFSSGVTGEDIFKARSQGGVVFVTGGGSTYISGGSTGWSTSSSRTMKTNIDPVDPQQALEGVDSLDVATWEYEDDGEGTGIRHIGPMAEEFHDAFDVGDSDEHINSINADGAAFAAIQGLSGKLDERDDRIDELEAELDEKDDRIDELEDRLAAVEAHIESTAPPADD